MEVITRSVNLSPMRYGCYFKDNNSAISIGVGNQCTFLLCGSAVPDLITEDHLIRQELSKWLKPTDKNELETMLSLFEKVIPIFPCRYSVVYLDLPEMRTMSIQKVFFHPIIRNCEAVIIITGGEEISSDDLNCILDTASCLRNLRIVGTSTPPYGYFHERVSWL